MGLGEGSDIMDKLFKTELRLLMRKLTPEIKCKTHEADEDMLRKLVYRTNCGLPTGNKYSVNKSDVNEEGVVLWIIALN